MFGILIMIVILVGINGFFAASEMALVGVKPSDIHKLRKQGNKRVEVLSKVTKDSTRYLSTIQVAITFAGFLSSAFAGSSLSGYLVSFLANIGVTLSEGIAVIIITVLLSFFTLVFGELVPKRIALSNSISFALLCAPVVNFVMITFRPFVWLLSISTRGVLKIAGIKHTNDVDQITETDIKEMIVYGHIKGLYQSEEKDMLNRIFRLDDINASMIMTPKQDVIGLDLNSMNHTLLHLVIESKYSRIPIFKGEEIEGVVLLKDIIVNFHDKGFDQINIETLVKPPMIIEDSMKINHLLHIMKDSTNHLAFVVDKDKHMLGIITLEDIIEEITGSIYDEHDSLSNPLNTKEEFSYILRGDMIIEEISVFTGLNINTDKTKTLEEYIKEDLNYTNQTLLKTEFGIIEILQKEKDSIKEVKLIIDMKRGV